MLILMLTIYSRIHHATTLPDHPFPHPPRKISSIWLDFEKCEQYLCSRNQINNRTRLPKTLPQRKKNPVLYQRSCRSQFPPWYPLFGIPPYIFPRILLFEFRGAVHSIIQSNVDSRLNEKEYNFSNSLSFPKS